MATRDSGRYGTQVTHVYRLAFKGFAATIPSDRVAALRADPQVRFLSPDAEVQATAQTIGTGVNRINAENKANKGAGVNVAVIDTGIDTNHPDLAANIVHGTTARRVDRRATATRTATGPTSLESSRRATTGSA